MSYNFKKLEKKWSAKWDKSKIYEAKFPSKKKKWYSLFEFPYPSGEGLHVGHLRPYVGMDVISRKRRMEGYNVLFPIGWDAFGLPTENYAIKTGIAPEIVTKKNTDNYRRQIKSIGPSLDWSREINTTDPDYYKWTQWLFLKFLEKGLAYKAAMPINWCPKDKIGLANEEVINGKCERCDTVVEMRNKEQWMLKITAYADKLLSGLEGLDYLPKIKTQQENWIGRSEGSEIEFQIANSKSPVKVFTTRPDTLFGATYLVLAPESKLVEELKPLIKNWNEVETYASKAKKMAEIDRIAENKEKTGVELMGVKAINPATKEEIPVFVADYVVSGYGTGAIMAVPAHDDRDYAFAKKFNLPIKQVIEPVFTQTNEPGKVISNLPFEERDAIIAIVKHWSEDKYIGLKWKEVAWGTFVTGGIEKGQTAEEAARMEIREETGYLNLKLISQFGTVHGKFYHVPKKVNRFAHSPVLYFELQNGDKEQVSAEEVKKHELAWFTKEELKKFLTADTHVRALEMLEGRGHHTEEGILINSGKFSGMESSEANKKIIEFVGGKIAVKYKLRDWIFSRQRYWGEPIPIIHCKDCGYVPVPEKDLPVKLPKVEKYQPTDTGESPLSKVDKWVNVKCPKCKEPARRETDTMPNWAGSSWYFLRYIDPKNNKKFADMKKLKYWMGVAPRRSSQSAGLARDDAGGVDWYNGGMEHVTLHLLYSRFWNQFFYDEGLVPTAEPYKKRTSHGFILGEGGIKMSKSRGNVVNPDKVIEAYGADALRLYEMFIGPFDQAIAWDMNGIEGVSRFLYRVWNISDKVSGNSKNTALQQPINRTIKKVGEDIESMAFNTAVSGMMIFLNAAEKENEIPKLIWEKFLMILAPFAPFITEELWEKLGNRKSIHLEKWPEFDESKLAGESFELIVQVNGKMRGKITVPTGINEADAKKLALADKNVAAHVTGAIKKAIFVPGRLINFVV